MLRVLSLATWATRSEPGWFAHACRILGQKCAHTANTLTGLVLAHGVGVGNQAGILL